MGYPFRLIVIHEGMVRSFEMWERYLYINHAFAIKYYYDSALK